MLWLEIVENKAQLRNSMNQNWSEFPPRIDIGISIRDEGVCDDENFELICVLYAI